LWVELPDVLATAVEASIGHAKTATSKLACSPTPVPTRSARRWRRLARRRASRSSPRTTSVIGASRCSTSGGVPWARIGEQVGQKNLAVTANTYTHVLADETELEYAELLAA